ncbi:hypothetical protein MGWOODY_Smn1342 [hydrothermal vent metagenome]|uniref:Uncharacterized protein n=1 Tax=hydrothermal vent metagenome TaxID=652676 RepID=A0A160TQM7_9ZZZZ
MIGEDSPESGVFKKAGTLVHIDGRLMRHVRKGQASARASVDGYVEHGSVLTICYNFWVEA